VSDHLRKHATNALPCPHCASMRKALDEARAHASGARKRETALRKALEQAERKLQSLRDRGLIGPRP
jgi:hypothetical protein